MKLVLELSRDELAKLPIAIIVESWHRVGGVNAGGKQRRAYHNEFTKNEIRKIQYWYNNYFYRWILIKGFPAKFVFKKIEDIELIKRAGNLFASV